MKTGTTPKVRRTPGKPGPRAAKPAVAPSLYEQLKAFDGLADDLPPDLSLQHDHYLYGTPKRTRA